MAFPQMSDFETELAQLARQQTARRSPPPGAQKIYNLTSGRRDTLNGPNTSIPSEWARTFDLIQEAAELTCAAEGRAQEMVGRAEALMKRAFDELQIAERRVQAAEAAQRSAEARAFEAESRMREAEEWLVRLQDALVKKLIEPRTANREQAA
jgi:prophage DNA circulation protein